MKEVKEINGNIGKRSAAAVTVAASVGAAIPVVSAAALSLKKQPLTDDDFITVNGTELVTAGGNGVFLSGVNIDDYPFGCRKDSELFAPGIRDIFNTLSARFGDYGAREIFSSALEKSVTKKDIKLLSKEKYNCIRIPLRTFLIFRNEKIKKDPVFKKLDKLVKICKKAGVYIILSLSSVPGADSDTFSDDAQGLAKRNDLIKTWLKTAEHFKNEPAIAAYDLLDIYSEKFSAEYTDLCLRTAKALKTVGDNHAVIVRSGASGEKLNGAYGQGVILASGAADEIPENRNLPVILLSKPDEDAEVNSAGIFAYTFKGTDIEKCLYCKPREDIDLDNDSFDEMKEKLAAMLDTASYTKMN